MIPPGVHFFSYQALGKDGAVGPPVSTLLDLKSKQVYIRKWDPATEGFVPLADEDEVCGHVQQGNWISQQRLLLAGQALCSTFHDRHQELLMKSHDYSM